MSRHLPSSILIVGSGVFGLSTAYELARHRDFQHAKLTLVDASAVPNPNGSSVSSVIIRLHVIVNRIEVDWLYSRSIPIFLKFVFNLSSHFVE